MYIHLWHVSCRTRRARLCARLHKASKTATLTWLDPMTSEGINWINPTFLESVEQIFADELVTNHQLGLYAGRISFGLLQSVETWHGNTKNHWDTIEARLLRFLQLYMSNKLKLTISHKNKGHTHTLTLKKFDRVCKRQGISETESFFWSLKPLRFRLSLAETNLALSKGNQLTTAISATERRMASDG